DGSPRMAPWEAHGPPVLAGVSFESWRRGTGQVAAAVHDRRRQAWAAILSVRGQSFPLLERSEQRRRVGGWAAALAVLARAGGGACRVQWVERARPDSGDSLGRFLREGLALDAWHPAAVSYAELVASAGPVTRRHETFVVLAVPARRKVRTLSTGATRTAGALAVLDRELAGLEARLRQADLVVDGVLGPRSLAWVLRDGFEPRAAVDREGTTDDPGGFPTGTFRARRGPPPEDPGGELAGAAPGSGGTGRPADPDPGEATAAEVGGRAWPIATHTTWSWFRCGEVHHVTYWISEWPRIDVGPDFLAPLLLGTQGARTVAVTMEPVDARRAARATESARVADVADEELRRRAGFLTSTRRRREAESVLRRESELADGHAEYRFSAYVTVSASTRRDLEAACSEVEQAAGQSQLELRRLHGRQGEAFTYTLPLARGLS
ncbi:MAG: SCO6880 family protein, partial [Acidimicrobiales bacterium]